MKQFFSRHRLCVKSALHASVMKYVSVKHNAAVLDFTSLHCVYVFPFSFTNLAATIQLQNAV